MCENFERSEGQVIDSFSRRSKTCPVDLHWPNEAYGTYVRQGDLFSFTEIWTTYLGGLDLDRQLIEKHIRETKSYKILSGSELRLYYDAENYVKFVKVN